MKGKGKRSLQLLMKLHLRAMECHLPYRITVLPATRHKWTHRLNPSHTGRYSIYLPWRDGRL